MERVKIFLVPVVLATLLAWWGCAELQDDLQAPVAPGVAAHPAGWTDKVSSVFHGNAIRTANWDMRPCQTCHGVTYTGGTSGSSCRDCHRESGGPESCATCHGGVNPAPPRDLSNNTATSARGVGAHQRHVLGSSTAPQVRCGECHVVPGPIYAPGHIDATPGAEVVFNNPLSRTVTNEPSTVDYDASLPLVTPAPSYNASTLSCASTYCHGNFKNGNTGFAPVWNDLSGAQAACGTCHGDVTKATLAERALPLTVANGGTHPDSTACYQCHPDVVDANVRIINAVKHVDGRLDIDGSARDF